MSDTPLFNQESVNAIVGHMNDDHADALVLYLQAFANTKPDADTATMTSIDANGIDISCQVTGDARKIRIEFSQTGTTEQLSNRGEARSVLVEMVKIAKTRL